MIDTLSELSEKYYEAGSNPSIKKDSNIKCRSFRLAKMWKTYEKYTFLNLFSIAVFVVDFTANYS